MNTFISLVKFFFFKFLKVKPTIPNNFATSHLDANRKRFCVHKRNLQWINNDLFFRIDANVEETQLNVEAAHSEILKYFKSVSSNRWLMIKIFGVLIIFFIIFVVFMA